MNGVLRQGKLCIFSIWRRRSFGTTEYKFKGKRKLPLFCYPLYLRLTINRIAELFDTNVPLPSSFFPPKAECNSNLFSSIIHLPMKTPIDSQAQRSKRSRQAKLAPQAWRERTNLLRIELRSFSIRTCRLSSSFFPPQAEYNKNTKNPRTRAADFSPINSGAKRSKSFRAYASSEVRTHEFASARNYEVFSCERAACRHVKVLSAYPSGLRFSQGHTRATSQGHGTSRLSGRSL